MYPALTTPVGRCAPRRNPPAAPRDSQPPAGAARSTTLASLGPSMAPLLFALALGACSDDPPPGSGRQEQPVIEDVTAPRPAVEGSVLRVRGAALDLVGTVAAQLQIREGETSAVLELAEGAARGERLFTLDGAAVDALGP